MMRLFVGCRSAVLLTAIGTYGVVSFSTAHRSYEYLLPFCDEGRTAPALA